MPNPLAESDDVAQPRSYHDPGQYISQAKLHVAEYSRKNVSESRLRQLRNSFYQLRRGSWSKKETKRLKRNWRRIKKYHPQYSDPKFAFSEGHDEDGQLTAEEVRQKCKDYRDFDVLSRMAYKLNQRLICDIYVKCRRLFYYRSFFHTSRKTIPKALLEQVRIDLEAGEAVWVIAHKYNISPHVIDTIKRRPYGAKRFHWTSEALEALHECVENLHNVRDITQMPARAIRWKRVKKEMIQRRYELSVEQCYMKWIRLYPRTVRCASPMNEE